MTDDLYPRWTYYPNWSEPPSWVSDLTGIFEGVQEQLDSRVVHRKSNEALAILRPGLEKAGFEVEGGENTPTIYRPVHFGEYGEADRTYRIDSYHPESKLALEVEAGRSLRGNAIYRDLIQTSLLVGVEFFP
jgi:hypothetical protein